MVAIALPRHPLNAELRKVQAAYDEHVLDCREGVDLEDFGIYDQPPVHTAPTARDAFRHQGSHSLGRLDALVAKVHRLVALALGTLAHAVSQGDIEWDTDETLDQAALRLLLDAAWHDGNLLPSSDYLWAAYVHRLGGPDYTLAVYAEKWLLARREILDGLATKGVPMTAALLDYAAAADRAGITRGTWSGYVSRGQAPHVDQPGGWYTTTVDAWRFTRPGPGARTDTAQPHRQSRITTLPNGALRVVQN